MQKLTIIVLMFLFCGCATPNKSSEGSTPADVNDARMKEEMDGIALKRKTQDDFSRRLEESTRELKNELKARKEEAAARSKWLISETKKNFGEYSIAISQLDISPYGFTLELLITNETATKLLYGKRFVRSYSYPNEQGGESTGYGERWSVVDNYGNGYVAYSLNAIDLPKDQLGPSESTRVKVRYGTKPVTGSTLKIVLHEFINGEYPMIEIPPQFTN